MYQKRITNLEQRTQSSGHSSSIYVPSYSFSISYIFGKNKANWDGHWNIVRSSAQNTNAVLSCFFEYFTFVRQKTDAHQHKGRRLSNLLGKNSTSAARIILSCFSLSPEWFITLSLPPIRSDKIEYILNRKAFIPDFYMFTRNKEKCVVSSRTVPLNILIIIM